MIEQVRCVVCGAEFELEIVNENGTGVIGSDVYDFGSADVENPYRFADGMIAGGCGGHGPGDVTQAVRVMAGIGAIKVREAA
jgi:hypothetical protein